MTPAHSAAQNSVQNNVQNSARNAAGLLLIAVPLVFTAGFTGLQMTFEYPDILRHPAGEVLTRFAGSGADLHAYWYAMMFAALLMTGGAIAAGLHFWKRDNLLAALSIGAGVLAGANMAWIAVDSYPGSPVSATVGTPGYNADGCALVTANARSLPAFADVAWRAG